MKKYFFIIPLIVITGLIFASTLGSSSTYLEAKTKPATFFYWTKSIKVPLPHRVGFNPAFMLLKATHYGLPDFLEGNPTATGIPVEFGVVAVSESPENQALPLGSTFLVENIKAWQGVVFRVEDTGPGVGKGQLDFYTIDESQAGLLGETVAIKVLTRGKS